MQMFVLSAKCELPAIFPCLLELLPNGKYRHTMRKREEKKEWIEIWKWNKLLWNGMILLATFIVNRYVFSFLFSSLRLYSHFGWLILPILTTTLSVSHCLTHFVLNKLATEKNLPFCRQLSFASERKWFETICSTDQLTVIIQVRLISIVSFLVNVNRGKEFIIKAKL